MRRSATSAPLDSPVRHEHARSPAAAPQESIYSVAFGWPIEQSVIQTTRRASSMQYQIRPALVTSNCHCSRSLPSTLRVPSEPLSGCCRSSRCRRSVVIRGTVPDEHSQMRRHRPGPNPLRRRSWRSGSPNHLVLVVGQPAPCAWPSRQLAGRGTALPFVTIAPLRRRASLESAWISAVALHSSTT